MQRFTKHALVAVTIAAALSTAALAHDDDDRACSVSTLHGSYMFAASGFNIVGGVAQPKAIVEAIDFNGDGTLSVPAATRSVNGVITQIPPGGTGNYALESGCTGNACVHHGPDLRHLHNAQRQVDWDDPDESQYCATGNGNAGGGVIASRRANGRRAHDLRPRSGLVSGTPSA